GLTLTGCASLYQKEEKRVLAAIAASKPATLSQWERDTGDHDSELLTTVARFSTAILFSGYKSLTVETKKTPGGTSLVLGFEGQKGSSHASAVPISRDGYFLTARHCLEGAEPPFSLVTIVKEGSGIQPVKTPFRIVWTGTAKAIDLALIHAPVRPAFPLKLAPPSAFQRGTPVAAAGWSGLWSGNEPISGRAAGRLLSFKEPTENHASRLVYHSAPLDGGDSGGPLINGAGQLLGIHSSGHYKVNPWPTILNPGKKRDLVRKYRALAIVPDQRALEQIMKADRRSPAPHSNAR
ncbi:MAG: serine protease, partial [Verrucomicrobiota bacterium]